MNVYILMEEQDQPAFTDNVGEEALPSAVVLGVYQDKDRAEAERTRLEEESKQAEKELNTDPTWYFVEERPLL